MAQDPNSSIDFLNLIPNYVWILLGVLIAGVLPWIGIYLQLRHDSTERRTSFLRDICLSAVEKIGQQIDYLANFFIRKEGQPDGYIDAINKLNIICLDETIKAINTFDEYLCEALFELIPLKDRVTYLESAIKALNAFFNDYKQKADKALQDMNEYNLQGVIDTPKWSVIQGDFDFAQSQEKEFMNESTKISDEALMLTRELQIKCQQKAQSAGELFIVIIIAIRKELNIPFDEQAYRKMMAISHKKWKQNLDKNIASQKEVQDELINKLQSIVDSQQSKP